MPNTTGPPNQPLSKASNAPSPLEAASLDAVNLAVIVFSIASRPVSSADQQQPRYLSNAFKSTQVTSDLTTSKRKHLTLCSIMPRSNFMHHAQLEDRIQCPIVSIVLMNFLCVTDKSGASCELHLTAMSQATVPAESLVDYMHLAGTVACNMATSPCIWSGCLTTGPSCLPCKY